MDPPITHQTKSLSENLCMKLEERRISPRMGLSTSPFSKEMPLMSKGLPQLPGRWITSIFPDPLEKDQKMPAQ